MLLLLTIAAPCFAADLNDVQTIQVKSTADGSDQPVRIFIPEAAKSKPSPMLVLLHSWSGDYKQNTLPVEAVPEADRLGWVVVIPNFRGRNDHPEACASDLASQDILDAVAHVQGLAKIDDKRIYIAGASGGGHMTLVMAARAPKLWAAASAWVPISDLAAWHAQTKQAGRRYWKMLEACTGGPPGESDAVDAEYRHRSPLFHLDAAKGLPIDINHGIHDGHTGSVPVSHSLRAFNRLAVANGHSGARVADDDIAFVVANRKLSTVMHDQAASDDPQREHAVLFQRTAGPARVTLFEGGHESDILAAIRWLAKHHR